MDRNKIQNIQIQKHIGSQDEHTYEVEPEFLEHLRHEDCQQPELPWEPSSRDLSSRVQTRGSGV
jgi:hypothetical protein